MELIITTKKGETFTVLYDAEDHDLISKYNWVLFKSQYTNYVSALINGKRVFMHRLLLGLEKGNPLVADHINFNGLDNRRSNIRKVTAKQNTQHKKPREKYYGVKKITLWSGVALYESFITINGRRKLIGRFGSEERAAKVHDDMLKSIGGDPVNLNFPDITEH